jgi:serine/threonine-protein kinase HipA
MSDRQLYVYVDLKGEPHIVGRLWSRHLKNKESASFEYDDRWLANPAKFALEPALTLGAGAQHTLQGRALFGAIGDSAPDRWGRKLIRRQEIHRAKTEKRNARTLGEIDYLLGVGDITRSGALRFSLEEGGPFLADGENANVPPLVRLGELLDATNRLAADEDDDSALRLLLAPGSSLGGARAKASVIDRDGTLAMAKFPQPDDDYPLIEWEAVSLDLAARAGIQTPEWRLEEVMGRRVLVLRRFDREGTSRIPFLSAMSMIGAADNEEHSYLELADAIRQYGARPEDDCAELWRRVVFNILISNTDDHLRNHGFLYEEPGGWRLSPVYDVNPMPTDIRERVLSLAIDEADTTASLGLALSVARSYGLKADKAKVIAREVGNVVSQWRERAAAIGLKASDMDRMASAFDHDDLAQAMEV